MPCRLPRKPHLDLPVAVARTDLPHSDRRESRAALRAGLAALGAGRPVIVLGRGRYWRANICRDRVATVA
jgi:hypothetical protein